MPELLVTAPREYLNEVQAVGAAYVYSALPTNPSQFSKVMGPDGTTTMFGWAARFVGDLNADGRTDVAVGDFTGKVRVYGGVPAGIADPPTTTLMDVDHLGALSSSFGTNLD